MSQRDSGKICSKCGRVYPSTNFQMDRHKPDGLRPDCKTCARTRRRAVYLRRRDAELAATKLYAKSRPEQTKLNSRRRYEKRVSTLDGRNKMRDNASQWRARNLEQCRSYDAKWMRDNPGDNAAKAALARARRRLAAPKWLTREQRAEMRQLYKNAAAAGMHVDHILPIAGREARGLHVPWNLQILPAEENLKKGNRLVATR